VSFLRRKKEKSVNSVPETSWIVELIGEKGISSIKEERTKSKEKISQFQKLYATDGLTFGLVNYLVSKIVSGILFIGGTETVKSLEAWAEAIGFKTIAEDIVRDVVIAGTAWSEPIWSAISIEDIKIINPDTMDYIRGKDGNAKLDEDGHILGYTQEIGGETRYWYKDRIESNGNILFTSKTEDLRDKLKTFKLVSFGDSELGISLLRAVYRTAIIRANIEDMIGESAFRGGGIVAYVTGQPPPETTKKLKDDMTNITSRNIFILRDSIKLGTVPIPDLANSQQLIYLLADLETTGVGVPLDALVAGSKSYRGDLATKMIDMETRIVSYQERLAKQFNEAFIFPLLKLWKVPLAYMKFSSQAPSTQLSRARVIATLARRTLMQYDPEMEMQLRKELGLPTELLDTELQKWKAGWRPNQEEDEVEDEHESKDVDVSDKVNKSVPKRTVSKQDTAR